MWHERIILKEKAGQHEQKKKKSQSQVTLVSENERGRAKNCERPNWFSKNKSFFLVNIIKWITEAKRDKNKRENDISLPLY